MLLTVILVACLLFSGIGMVILHRHRNLPFITQVYHSLLTLLMTLISLALFVHALKLGE